MAIIQEEITIGANKFYKIYSDNGYMLKNNYNTILREFYNKNYIEALNDNYTEIIDLSIDITNDELILGIALIISSDIQDNVNELINTLTLDVIELTGDVNTNTNNINDLSTNVNSDINDLSANITVLSNDVSDLNLDNVLLYYNIKSEEKYEETNSGTDNYTISTGFYICASKLGIKNNSDKNKLKSLTIKIGTNAGAGADCDNVKAILLNINDDNDVLESSNIVSIKPADSNKIKIFEFNTNISNIDINAIYKVIFINTGTGEAIKINYRVFACDTAYKTYLNLVASTDWRPIVSVYFEELTDYILLNNTINDANIDDLTNDFINKTFIKTSDDLTSVISPWPGGYPLKLYPRFFKPSSNKINLKSLSLHCPTDNRNKNIELELSVLHYVYLGYKKFIGVSKNKITLTGNDLIITFNFDDLELDVDNFYMFEHGKNIALYAIKNSAGTSEDNMNCILLYNSNQLLCNLPVLSANFDDNIGKLIRDKSFNKEVSSIVENYLVDYDPAVDENRVHDIVDLTFNSRIINISDDDYKTLLDNNLLDPNVIYILSSSNNTIDICEKRIINVADGIEDSDAATISLLKLSTEILTLMITDLTNRLNALENN